MMTNAATMLGDIYQRQLVVTPQGESIPLHSGISPEEGRFILDIIGADASVARTLEIGCAYGISSLNICSAIQGRPGEAHTIIDPFQTTQWRSVGVANLGRAGLRNFELVEEKSEFALPRILKGQEGAFDFIFVDGWHTFDHALLDSFYATRLLRVGGYLVLDDASWKSVGRMISYLQTYPCYTRIGGVPNPGDASSPKWKARLAARILPSSAKKALNSAIRWKMADRYSMVALKKTAEDARSWDWFAEF